MKKYILSLFFIFSISLLCAQQLPKWITHPVASKANCNVALSSGNTLEEARHSAVNRLIGLAAFTPQEGSYQYKLLESGDERIDQHKALLAKAEQSAYFRNANTFVTDSACWVQCSVTADDMKAFLDSLYADAGQKVRTMMARADSLKACGDVFTAASVYADAINAVIPVLHLPLSMDDGSDIMTLLHENYKHSLDNIVWQWERELCPMVKGEDLPIALYAVAKVDDKVVPGLPVSFDVTPDGKLTCDNFTDENGRAKTHVTEAPDAETGFLIVTINPQKLSLLPHNIFAGELTAQVTEEAASAQMELKSFDPTPFYYMALDEADIASIGDSITATMQRYSYEPIETEPSSDIVIRLDYNCQPEGNPTTGKYPMQYMSCEMHLLLVDKRTDATLLEVDKLGYRYFVTADTPSAVIRDKTLYEMMKRVRLQFNTRLRDLGFDKRKVVFSI